MRIVLWLWVALVSAGLTSLVPAQQPAQLWVSTEDMQMRMQQQPPIPWTTSHATRPVAVPEVVVDPGTSYQTMLGMGASLEPTTCWNLSLLSAARRREVLERLLLTESGAGMNLMRICMGTPDFTRDPWYSYHDLAEGEADPELAQFSIDKDRRYILPVLKEALAVRPDLLFFASPWSPPAWMKSSKSLNGGSLLPEHYASYARYFVKFIQAYQSEGIPIHAVTIQNEPGVDRLTQSSRWHYPSCRWTGEQERDFIRDHLGPALREAGLQTRIWTYDHNYNLTPSKDDPGLEYPTTVLSDARAAAFVDGVAFHGYEGKPDGMSVFRERFPKVPVHFTEGSVFGMRGVVKLLDILRNWASSYNAWVIMIDENKGPNNGPFRASRTIITLDSKAREVHYHNDFYFYSQVMRFVARGAVRVESRSGSPDLHTVAFRNPDGQLVLIAANNANAERVFRLRAGDAVLPARLPPLSTGTFVWRP